MPKEATLPWLRITLIDFSSTRNICILTTIFLSPFSLTHVFPPLDFLLFIFHSEFHGEFGSKHCFFKSYVCNPVLYFSVHNVEMSFRVLRMGADVESRFLPPVCKFLLTPQFKINSKLSPNRLPLFLSTYVIRGTPSYYDGANEFTTVTSTRTSKDNQYCSLRKRSHPSITRAYFAPLSTAVRGGNGGLFSCHLYDLYHL